MRVKGTYKLNKDITKEQLHASGFKNETYKTWVYKDIIQLIITVSLEEKWWDFQVYDVDTYSIYTPYYIREYGVSDVVKKIDKNVKKVFKELEKKNVLIRRK